MNGYKTYLSAGALFLFAVYGLFTGHLDADTAITLIFNAAALAGLRHAVSTK